MSRLVAAALTTLVTAACGGDVPTDPTWFGDVQPLLSANCGRCHGAQPYQPSLAGFRLDRYVAGDSALDVYDFREAIIARAVRRESPAMPLDYPLTDRQRLILQRWVDAGAPRGQRANTAPGATPVSPADARVEVDQSLELTFRAFDADGDGLVVSLLAREAGDSGGDLVAAGLAQGMQTAVIDTGVLASKQSFEIIAVLDDGFSDNPADNQTEVVLLSDVFVDHGARGTAPRVNLIAPSDGGTIIGSTTIRWSATDPDPGDEILTIDLDLLQVEADGSETAVASIASGLTSDQQELPWDVTDIPTEDASGQPIRYKVRVTATDTGARNVRSDSSDVPFTIAAGGNTDFTWDDVRPVFATYCLGCHGEPARQPGIDDFRFDKYDAADPVTPINGDLGVYEMRSQIQSRLVVLGTMPPPAEPQPSSDDVAMIDNWIRGGAPRGDGSGNGPTFVWNTPNNAQITTTTTGMVTLSWTATDPAGGLFTGTISQTTISPPSDALAECAVDLPGFTEVPGVDINAGSHPLSLPTGGYYCFRADVTTAGGEALPPQVAAEPIKYDRPGPGL